jgi:hypothetical protein
MVNRFLSKELVLVNPPVAPGLTFNLEFSAEKDGTVSGTYALSVVFGDRVLTVEEGTFTDGSTDGSIFSLTGEGESMCPPPAGQSPAGEVTINGDCGDDVTINYEDPFTEGTVTGNVECTLT